MHAMTFLLQNTGILDMINYSGIDNNVPGRPTWCPYFYSVESAIDASRSSRHLVGLTGRHAFTCRRDKLAYARFVWNHQILDKLQGADCTVLEVNCCCVDVISQCLLYRSGAWIGGENQGSWKLGLSRKLRQRYRASSSTWIKDKRKRHKIDLIKILYYFLLDTDSASLRNQGEFAGEDERSDELWQTLTYGRTPEGSIAPGGWSRAFSILIKGPVSDSMDSTPETYNHSSIEVAMSLVEHFMAAAEDVIGSGRWLFMTKAGRLGIANLTASVGDLLCPVDQLVRLVNWATFLVQYVNICHLINWAAIDKWQMTYSQYY
jgi:hypothetical protein